MNTLIKGWLIPLVISLMLTSCVLGPLNRKYKHERMYDSKGQYQGKIIDNGHSKRIYNRDGKFIGRIK